MYTKFKKLFEEYGFVVEQISEDSFVADNGVYCVPYTEYDNNGNPEMWAITIDSFNKESLKELFKCQERIGCAAWCKHICKKLKSHAIGSEVWNPARYLKRFFTAISVKLLNSRFE